MIKADVGPDLFVMAAITLIRQLTQALTVWTGLFVTAEAIPGRFGKFLFRIMALAADHGLMPVLQGKIG